MSYTINSRETKARLPPPHTFPPSSARITSCAAYNIHVQRANTLYNNTLICHHRRRGPRRQ